MSRAEPSPDPIPGPLVALFVIVGLALVGILAGQAMSGPVSTLISAPFDTGVRP